MFYNLESISKSDYICTVILKTIFFTLHSLIPIEDLKRWPERVATFFALSASLVHWHITTFVHARGKKLHFEKTQCFFALGNYKCKHQIIIF